MVFIFYFFRYIFHGTKTNKFVIIQHNLTNSENRFTRKISLHQSPAVSTTDDSVSYFETLLSISKHYTLVFSFYCCESLRVSRYCFKSSFKVDPAGSFSRSVTVQISGAIQYNIRIRSRISIEVNRIRIRFCK